MFKSSSLVNVGTNFRCSFPLMKTFLLVIAFQCMTLFTACSGDAEVISNIENLKNVDFQGFIGDRRYVSNLTVSVQKFKNFTSNELLQLKINWINGKDDEPKEGFEVEITRESKYACGHDIKTLYNMKPTIEYPTSPATNQHWLRRKCFYTIVVSPTPTSMYMESRNISFQIPACLYGKCSCSEVKLDKPDGVQPKHIDSSVIEVTWKFPPSAKTQNISFIYFEIKPYQEKASEPWKKLGSFKVNVDSNNKPLSTAILKEDIHLANYALHNNVKYMLRARYVSVHECISSFSTTSFLARAFHTPGNTNQDSNQISDSGLGNSTSHKENRNEESKQIEFNPSTETDVFSQILLPVFISIALLIVVLYTRQKCKKWCQKNILKIPSPARAIQPANDTFRFDGISAKLIPNDIYVTDRYEISRTQLKLGKLIGIGAFGEVFIAQLQTDTATKSVSTVAVKTLKDGASTEDINEFKTEISMLKMIGKHENVVTILGCCTEKQPYLMVMEYVPCGDLRHYLQALRKEFEHQNVNNSKAVKPPTSPRTPDTSSDCSYITPDGGPTPNNSRTSMTETEYTLLVSEPSTPGLHAPTLEKILDPRELQSFAVQIAKGMKYLQDKQIVHRDLAARNVLIDEYKTLKISDFGMSRTGVYTNTKRRKLPLRWMAIESIKENLYTSKSDVWSYGIVLWEIGTLGGFPYPTVANHELLNYLLTGNRLECPENCTEDLYKVMLCCWKYSPDSRPSFVDLLDLLDDVGRRKKTYVDFSCLNPSYVFPPTEEQPRQSHSMARLNFSTVEIVLPTPNCLMSSQQ